LPIWGWTMIVIADSNLIISGLYTPQGIVAKILTSEKNIQFIAPDFIFKEISNHFLRIQKETGRTRIELKSKLDHLIQRIKFVPVTEIPMDHIHKAIEIVKDIDIDDTFFVALHLYKKHKIWTGDRALINGLAAKGYDIFITTDELKSKLYKR